MASKRRNEQILVVGGSLAGLRTIQALRREDHTGPVTLLGAESHWPPYDRPPLSKQVLLGSLDHERARLRVPEDPDLQLLVGRAAVALDLSAGTVAVDDGSSLPYDKLVIATGAQPRTLPRSGGLRGTHVLRTIDDCLRLRSDLARARRVAVIGAGFIGCEVASACRTMGIDVSVIDALPLPLSPLGDRIGTYLTAILNDAGVDLHLGRAVSAVVGKHQVEGVDLDDGTRVDADVVVQGIGVSPATAWLESSGLTLLDGVVCDSSCLAVGGAERVAAVGDVARWDHPRAGLIRVEHWTNATEQAAHVAKALLLGPEAAGAFDPMPYFWSDLFGSKLQLVGFCRPDQTFRIIEGSMSEHRFVATYASGGSVDAVLCVNMPKRLAEWQARLAAPEPVPASV